MQKWKLILPALLILSSMPFVVHAEMSAPGNTVTVKEGEQEVVPAPVQEHMLEMMQDDFSFQNERRSLTNELELERLRAEIQKVKGISTPVSVAQSIDTPAEPAETGAPDENKMEEVLPLPKVLLISDIGGITRAAVSSNGVVTLVKMNEKVSLDGHQYIVSHSGKNMPSIREVNK